MSLTSLRWHNPGRPPGSLQREWNGAAGQPARQETKQLKFIYFLSIFGNGEVRVDHLHRPL